MATSFFLRTKETQGYTTLFVRLQSRKLGINYKLSTNLEVDIKAWQKAQDSAQALQKFQAKEPKLWAKLDKLKQTLDTLLSGDEVPSKEKMRTIIDEPCAPAPTAPTSASTTAIPTPSSPAGPTSTWNPRSGPASTLTWTR